MSEPVTALILEQETSLTPEEFDTLRDVWRSVWEDSSVSPADRVETFTAALPQELRAKLRVETLARPRVSVANPETWTFLPADIHKAGQGGSDNPGVVVTTRLSEELYLTGELAAYMPLHGGVLAELHRLDRVELRLYFKEEESE